MLDLESGQGSAVPSHDYAGRTAANLSTV
jgi:hypothetical protein